MIFLKLWLLTFFKVKQVKLQDQRKGKQFSLHLLNKILIYLLAGVTLPKIKNK